jgi:hypothetical protein
LSTEQLDKLSTVFYCNSLSTESDGTEAFNQLVAAVNSADERVKGFEGELKQVLDKAVSRGSVSRSTAGRLPGGLSHEGIPEIDHDRCKLTRTLE